MAQATITGNINYGVTSVNGAAGTGAVKNGNTVGFHDTNLTIAASEDLGGGMRVSGSATLETAAGGGARGGTLNFADRSMSLAGDFGTVTLANTRSSNLAISAGVFASYLRYISWDQGRVAADGALDSDTGSGVAGRSVGNLIAYTTPELVPGLRVNAGLFILDQPANCVASNGALGCGSVTGAEAYHAGRNALAGQKGRVTFIGATYASGPLSVAAAYKANNNVVRAATTTNKPGVTEANVRYDLGVAQVGVGIATATGTGNNKNLMVLGVNAPVADALTVGFNYGVRGKARYSEMGGTYALSKRTNITAHTGQFRDAAVATTKTQSRVSLRHAF
jgi:hypothetical protein